MLRKWPIAGALAISCQFVLAALTGAAESENAFRDQVAPILERRCITCHNAEDRKGGLSLESAESVENGGDSGSPITAGSPNESFLLEVITPAGDKARMPKDADPLKPDEIAAIRKWIESGGKWPEGMKLAPARVTNTDWWSLRPIERPTIPKLSLQDEAWVRNPIDAFVAAKHAELKLGHAAEADRHTLIRRLYFDLIGLPPTPEQIESFATDKNPQAYEKLVDSLLDSPQFGERWARHWLDVVHFGETHGYDKDQPRPNAWPYRDYVIRAFNEDRPYARFIEEQIAGDVLYPGTRDGLEALGFIAAGPWDLIGHIEVPESKTDGKIARHLDRDDMVTNTIQSFASLTIQCAQCHNHKFDPILQEDYYSLQSVFAAVDRADQRYDAEPQVAAKRLALEGVKKKLTEDRAAIDARIRETAGERLTRLDEQIAAQQALAKQATYPAEHGYHSGIEAKPDVVKWVQVDLKEPAKLSKVVLHACHDDFNNIGDGFGFPVRYTIDLSNDPEFKTEVVSLVDHTDSDVANPKLAPVVIEAAGKAGRYIRLTARRLSSRLPTDFIFSLSELEAFDSDGKNLARDCEVTSLDSIEAPNRWRRSNLVDGLFPSSPGGTAESLLRLEAERKTLVANSTSASDREAIAKLDQVEKENAESIANLPPQLLSYIGAVHTGSGNFIGTGASAGRPRPIHVLHRGNINQPGKEVLPGTISAISTLPSRFDLPEGHSEGARRAALAKWLSNPNNPLTWRSIVNRVWHYHFGRGIVDSPNDFGRNGRLPSHSELLDWLATEFRDSGGSLKSLHRLIVTSATYRQASESNADLAREVDAENRFLWKSNRRKLEAEELRDAVLVLAGKLNRTMYGPSFRDFVVDKPEHSPHYEYHLHDPEDVKSHRRSVYRFLVRSQPQPFMAALDCADPSMQVDKRNESQSALQALALLNNGFMVSMSKHFAERLEKLPGDLEAKVERGYFEAMGHRPSEEQKDGLVTYAKAYGLPNMCRVLLNLNEFVFVE